MGGCWRRAGTSIGRSSRFSSLYLIAEDIVAAIHPDWKRTKPFTKSHDFIEPDGSKVEVKAY